MFVTNVGYSDCLLMSVACREDGDDVQGVLAVPVGTCLAEAFEVTGIDVRGEAADASVEVVFMHVGPEVLATLTDGCPVGYEPLRFDGESGLLEPAILEASTLAPLATTAEGFYLATWEGHGVRLLLNDELVVENFETAGEEFDIDGAGLSARGLSPELPVSVPQAARTTRAKPVAKLASKPPSQRQLLDQIAEGMASLRAENSAVLRRLEVLEKGAEEVSPPSRGGPGPGGSAGRGALPWGLPVVLVGARRG